MKLFVLLTLSMFLCAAVYAQNPPQQPPPTAQDQDSQAVTVTGCLYKGQAAGEYVITDSKSGEKMSFPGPDRLDTYVNHTVQLTGKMMNRAGEKTFQPQSIRTLSDTCSGGL